LKDRTREIKTGDSHIMLADEPEGPVAEHHHPDRRVRELFAGASRQPR
jgi:hypothetical protein